MAHLFTGLPLLQKELVFSAVQAQKRRVPCDFGEHNRDQRSVAMTTLCRSNHTFHGKMDEP